MKKIVAVFTVCMIASSLAMAAGGTIPPTSTTGTLPADLSMITSTKALESYAKEQVAQGSSWAGSNGTIMPGGKTWGSAVVQDPDIRVIQEQLEKDTMSFRVLDPNAQQYLSAQFMDNMGYSLFYGQNNFKLVQTASGGWKVPEDARHVDVDMCSQIPINLPGVDYAFAVSTDPVTGQRQYVDIHVENERVLFPTSMAGIAGWQVIIQVGNNSAAYNIATGVSIPSTPVTIGANASIRGLIAMDDPVMVVSSPISTNGQGENPLYQISITNFPDVVLLARTSESESAEAVIVRKVGNPEMTQYPMQSGSITLHFVPGVWDVWFVYPSGFGENEPVVPNYQYGGGMG